MIVLGISIGTRTSGVAVVHSGELLESRTLNTRAASSDIHAETFGHYVRQYRIGIVVIKVPPLTHVTERMGELLKRVVRQFEYHGCMVEYKDTAAIKRAYPSIANKRDLMEFAVSHYPLLLPIIQKELSNSNKYHEKMFEAVVVAHLVRIKNDISNRQ